jgi:hypothetical protein
MSDHTKKEADKIHHLVQQVNRATNSANANITGMMSDARYLRQSSALINDALQKGFDVMQLADGSVVISGMKTVSYQYYWDESAGKLVRQKAVTQRASVPVKHKVNMDELDAEDAEEEMFSIKG